MNKKLIRALIVDDLPESRDDIKEHTDVLGHSSDMASCVEEAKNLLSKNCYNYVVLDLQVPNRKNGPDKIEYGMAILNDIIASHTYTGIVVVTAHGKTYSHVVEVMSRSPLVRYAPKPFDNDPRNPRLTDMILQVLKKSDEYQSAGLLPCLYSKRENKDDPCPIGIIDVKVLRRKKKLQIFCLVNNVEQSFSIREHQILCLYAQEQANHSSDPERHKVPLDSDLFNIHNDYNCRHSALSRFRTKVRKYLPEGHPKIMENLSDREYCLGCYCIDSTI